MTNLRPIPAHEVAAPPHSFAEVWMDSVVRSLPLKASQLQMFLPGEHNEDYLVHQYRLTRTEISRVLPRPFLLAVSSPGVGDGKTTSSINLAATLSLNNRGRTLLLDGDFRGSNVHRALCVDAAPGLSEVLGGICRTEQATVRFPELPSLYVLPAGGPRENPTDLLDSVRWNRFGEHLRQHFTQIVIDCPPVGFFADFELISSICSGVLLVVRPDHTNRSLCMEALKKVKPRLTGVLVNESRDWFLWKRSTRSYYPHYGQTQPKPASQKILPLE